MMVKNMIKRIVMKTLTISKDEKQLIFFISAWLNVCHVCSSE